MGIVYRFKWSYWLLLVFIVSSCSGGLIGKPTEIAKAIPNHVIFIVKANHLEQVDSTLAKLPYENVLRDFSWLNTVEQNHAALSAVLTKLTGAEVANFPMVSSLHLAKATALNSIHYYPLSLSKKAYHNLLEDNFSSSAKQQWNYENATFTEILIPELNQKMTLVYTSGILIASQESFLVEDAVKQLHSSNGILNDDAFQKVHNKESNDADLNVWFNLKNIKRWTSVFANPEGSNMLAKIKNYASWMLFDVYLNESDIYMTGLTSTTNKDVLHQYKGKSSCSHAMAEVLPVNTAIHNHFAAIPDSLKEYFNEAGINQCWSKILIEPLKQSEINEWICIFEKSENDVIDRTKVESLGAKLLGQENVHSKAEGQYFAVAKEANSIDNFFSSFKNKQVLANDESYTALSESLKGETNASIYVRSIYTKEAFKAIYNDNSNANQHFDVLRGFNQLALQFSHQNDVFHTNATFTYNPETTSRHSNIAWSTSLESPMIAGPQIIEFNGKGEHGVLVQDANFNLYLINKGGEIIWKKTLDSKWLGEAKALQLYNDNAKQITLNTELSWFLLDEDANDMAGFPLKFKDKATTGLTLAQLSGKHVVFIGLENKNLYGYEISGKPLTGWNPKNRVGILNFPVDVVLQNGKSYVVAHTDNGKLTIWNETGKELSSTNFKEDFNAPFYVDLKANPFKLKNVKSNGELVSFNPSGRVGKYKLSANKATTFRMANVTGNKDPEIIISDGKSVYIYSYTGSLIYRTNQAGDIEIVNPDEKGLEHIVVQNDDKIAVINSKGKISTAPDFYVGNQINFGHLIGENQTALVTNGTENEVICYRISVE